MSASSRIGMPAMTRRSRRKVARALQVAGGCSVRARDPVQRAVHLRRMRELTEMKRSGNVVDTLLADHGLFHLEADLRWIDLTSARLQALAETVRVS